MIVRAALLVVPALVAVMLAGGALGNPAGRTDMEQAKAAGWNCDPEVLIIGYYHCAPPGKASVLDLIEGRASPANLTVRVFNPDGSFAGIESLLRADLYGGQPCPQDNLAQWGLLELPVPYRACHHFDA